MQTLPRKLSLAMAAGASSMPDTARAAEAACEQCLESLGTTTPVDTAFLFFSQHHNPRADLLASIIRRRLAPTALFGVSTSAAIGGVTEMENTPGLSILAARMPGVTTHPFTFDDLPALNDHTPEEDRRQALVSAIGGGDDLRLVTLFTDPSSVPLVRTLPALSAAAGAPIFGGLASATPDNNIFILNDRVLHEGAIGLSFRGNLRVDTLVSQGCRAFGPMMVVTKAKGNLILELGGRNAIEAVQEAVLELGDGYAATLAGGLFIGRVINEYQGRFGKGDYLIRNVIGVNAPSKGIAVADRFRVGQTLRLHCRDAAAADEDLSMLLDAQKLYERPSGALLITCNGRGRKMFAKTPTPNNHDALMFARAFDAAPSGAFLSKSGTPFEAPAQPPIPLAGMFAAGEIGPVGEESFLHGQTACFALFRDGGEVSPLPEGGG